MTYSFIIHSLLLIPVLGFLMSLLLPGTKENLISRTAGVFIGLHTLLFLCFLFRWLYDGQPDIHLDEAVLFRTTGYEFRIALFFDRVTAVYLATGSVLTFLVTVYSRYYLHREQGYKRFFNTLLFFYTGYTITVFSGNLETLFIGWEILGLCSFLLIAFYRDRVLPARNALKVYTVYRIGDIGLLLAMWMGHQWWHHSVSFYELSQPGQAQGLPGANSLAGIFISLMLLTAAAAKSAQLPFSSWLPRAMEGPTPSSAIFYGSLSVHFGVFLLLRTFPLWEHQYPVRVLIGLLGLSTSLITIMIARVQSSVKSQIAYSSAAQIGLIFVEMALGLETIALLHFAGNAFLRTYQLLVSPSVVSYLIREQFYHYSPRTVSFEDSWPKKTEYSVYLLSLKEWNLDLYMARFFWDPLKRLGRKLNFLSLKSLFLFFIPVYGAGLFCLYTRAGIPRPVHQLLPLVFSLTGLLMVLKAFSEKKQVIMSWLLIIMNHFWVALAVSFNEEFQHDQVHLYLSGVVFSGALGYICLRYLLPKTGETDLSRFHGLVHTYPKTSFLFLLACLGLTGFPITPAFIGEDLIFSHIHKDQYMLAFTTAFSFIIDGLALIRLYSRLFLGPSGLPGQSKPYTAA
jgi:NADH-quinone oxidoreductase subunit L